MKNVHFLYRKETKELDGVLTVTCTHAGRTIISTICFEGARHGNKSFFNVQKKTKNKKTQNQTKYYTISKTKFTQERMGKEEDGNMIVGTMRKKPEKKKKLS